MWWWGSALLASLALSGCGYTLNHRLHPIFNTEKGIYVSILNNRSDEMAAEIVFTNALIRELQSRGEIVLTTKEKAAYELRGNIDGLTYGMTAATEPGYRGLYPYQRLATEMGVTVNITLTLLDLETNRVVWKRNFDGFRRVSAPPARTFDWEGPTSIGPQTQSLAETTYPAIAQDIMRDVYDEMVELF